MNNLKKLPKIIQHCMTIGELPTSYKISLTYEEQLLWFCNFLENEVIPVVNNNSEVVEELKHYLENLDIQEEINEKLEKMAESGQLADIIADYIQLRGLLCYNNIEDMKNAENIVEGSFLKTFGFYNYNDGGGSFYKVRTITNQDNVDNMILFDLNNEHLVAELINIDNSINILQLGAVKNDSSKNILNTNIINKALDNFSVVLIPEGTFYINSIVMKKEKTLKGINNKKSILKYIGNSNNSLIIIGNETEYIFDTTIENLQLEQASGITNLNGIEYIGNNPAYSIINHCNIMNLSGDGIKGGHSGHVNNVEIKECFITECKNGINMQYGEGQINAIWIHHNNIVRSIENGILFYGNNVIIESNTIQANNKHAISIGDENWNEDYTQFCLGSIISNNYTELNGNNFEFPVIGLYCGYNSNRNYNRFIRNTSIINNYFNENNSQQNYIIGVYNETSPDPSAKTCTIFVKNNFSNTQNFIYSNYNNSISFGSIVKNNSVLSDKSILPYYVEKENTDLSSPNLIHNDNYQTSKFNYSENIPANSTTQRSFLIYCDSTNLSADECDWTIYQLYTKILINGLRAYGAAGQYNSLIEKEGNNVNNYDGSIKKQVELGSETYVPLISPITLVKNHPELTGNARVGLMISIVPQNNLGCPYSLKMILENDYSHNHYLRVKKLSPTIKAGNGVPSGNIDFEGQTYFDKTNRKCYIASSLTTWREASTN